MNNVWRLLRKALCSLMVSKGMLYMLVVLAKLIEDKTNLIDSDICNKRKADRKRTHNHW